MKTVTIDVTQEDINQGTPLKSCACPIALAAGRVFSHRSISVGVWSMEVGTAGYTVDFIMLPAVASHFVLKFDNGLPVTPFSFEIETEAK